MSHHLDAIKSAAFGFAVTALIWAPSIAIAHVEKAERIEAYELAVEQENAARSSIGAI